MIRLNRGDVVTALFFQDNQRTGVVVISTDFQASENVTLCPITSTLVGGSLRVRVLPGASGLTMTSEVMPYRVTTLPLSRIGTVVGRLSDTEVENLNRILKEWLNL
ncbi:MAG: type II toxin-antitoxin system PemK/MazF family toxin [Pseudomonadota bacterium]|nr:type II toxin-antitoxin system PemK/MazF family toxin [Pseudomonadota bacterium]